MSVVAGIFVLCPAKGILCIKQWLITFLCLWTPICLWQLQSIFVRDVVESTNLTRVLCRWLLYSLRNTVCTRHWLTVGACHPHKLLSDATRSAGQNCVTKCLFLYEGMSMAWMPTLQDFLERWSSFDHQILLPPQMGSVRHCKVASFHMGLKETGYQLFAANNGSMEYTLAAETIEQGRRSLVHFLCPVDKHCCLPYHFPSSKLIFLKFHSIFSP